MPQMEMKTPTKPTTRSTMNAENPTIDDELNAYTTDDDRATAAKYLSLIEDRARVSHIADDYDVREDDLKRIIYALGASLEHEIREDEENVIYTGDGYMVTADVGHRGVVEETISRAISDGDALDAEREMAEKYDVDVEEIDDEDAIAHYRDQLPLAVIKAMRELDDSGHNYPVGYPLVVLTE